MSYPDAWFRPALWARNESRNTITGNVSSVLKWELPPLPDPNYIAPVPWDVADEPGFTRAWERGEVTVALDPDFITIITELPMAGSMDLFRPRTFVHETPATVHTFEHNLHRNGPVIVQLFSLDGQIEWTGFTTDMVDPDTVRVTMDDPEAVQATVY